MSTIVIHYHLLLLKMFTSLVIFIAILIVLLIMFPFIGNELEHRASKSIGGDFKTELESVNTNYQQHLNKVRIAFIVYFCIFYLPYILWGQRLKSWQYSFQLFFHSEFYNNKYPKLFLYHS